MKKEVLCMVYGRVQMVMFRDFTRRNARRLGLVGTVQNLGDGTVRVVAQGEEEKLKIFIEKIHRGPTFARVDKVDVVWKDTISAGYSDFDIIY